MNETYRSGSRFQEPRQSAPAPKKKKKSGLLGRIIRRFFLLLFTVIVLAVAALCLVLNLVFNGPSPAARKILTMSLTEASATKWVPGLFLDEETVAEIRRNVDAELPDEVTDTSQVVIQTGSLSGNSDEWADYPDGIYVEDIQGKTYNAHIMIIRDPSQVYMATSTSGNFSRNVPGKRITEVIETEGAIAAVNAGAFFDNGTAGPEVGSTPEGLVIAGGQVRWNSGKAPEEGFVGFNEDNIMVVAKTMTADDAMKLNIRDGCCFGPVLIMNGEVSMEAYNSASGYNPRTALGQRRDGAVIFLCIDGRQAGSLGGTYADIIDIMLEYGAVNACNMDGGSSSVMLYRDTYGRYGDAGQVRMMNTYSVIQAEPRKMPNFWMVRPASEG
ncbi:MAG: phosphodiester glycosidase family protein [Candidatus Faecousia sp.]|nr:phosphodiester glycosidase family protein [Clostridiales bacterium]MDY6181498.1 phosphodiester glycosidase family protein [Candidatus Faecousia sp.]